MMKKHSVWSLVLAFCLCFMVAMPAMAAEETNEQAVSEQQLENIVDTLNNLIGKKNFGLENVSNVSELSIGKCISVYNYTENGFEQGMSFYPILHNNELVIIAREFTETHDFSFTTSLVDNIKENINNNDEFALIFDQYNCYLFDGSNWTLLKEYHSFTNENNIPLNTLSRLDCSQIKLCDSLNDAILIPSFYRSLERQVTFWCDIDFVRQTGDNTCWAATLASVANYRNNTNWSEYDVVEIVKGTRADLGLSSFDYAEALNKVGLTNYKNLGKLSGDGMVSNIGQNYPIWAQFAIRTGATHSCVIHGIVDTLKEIYVMDPEEGFVTAENIDGNYQLVYGHSIRPFKCAYGPFFY